MHEYCCCCGTFSLDGFGPYSLVPMYGSKVLVLWGMGTAGSKVFDE